MSSGQTKSEDESSGLYQALGFGLCILQRNTANHIPSLVPPLSSSKQIRKEASLQEMVQGQGWNKRRREIQELFQVKNWQICDQQKPALSKGLGLALETTHGVDCKQSVRSC